MNVSRTAYRRLWSAPRPTLPEAVREHARAHLHAVQVVRAFYVCSLFWTLQQGGTWRQLLDADAILPQAPAWWLESVGLDVGVPLVLVGYVGAALAAAALPHRRGARLLYAVALLQHMSLQNSFGKVGAGFDTWFFVSAILVLLPTGPWRRRDRVVEKRSFLMVFWFAQLSVAFAYTLTGYWKVVAAVLALGNEEISAFHPDSLAITIATAITARGRDPILADVLIEWRLLGWALFNATMYLEVTSLLIVFRPRLHRVWGMCVILFHFGTTFAMDVSFPANVMLVGLLFVCSPFTPRSVTVREVVLDLPGIHLLARLLAARARRRAARVAAPEPAPRRELEEVR